MPLFSCDSCSQTFIFIFIRFFFFCFFAAAHNDDGDDNDNIEKNISLHHSTYLQERRYICLDGDVDSWMENMNSIMDDNKLLTLANGERIRLENYCSLLFEVSEYIYKYIEPENKKEAYARDDFRDIHIFYMYNSLRYFYISHVIIIIINDEQKKSFFFQIHEKKRSVLTFD